MGLRRSYPPRNALLGIEAHSLQAMRNTGRFELLDGYRGIAALVVLGTHLMGVSSYQYLPGAYLAVDLFFVMSGFVIAHAYEAKLLSGMGPAEFMLRRWQRLFPLLAVGVLIGAVVHSAIIGPIALMEMAIRGMLLVPELRGSGQLFNLDGPSWSLLFEISANVAYALIVKRLSSRALFAIVFVAGSVMIQRAYHYGGLDFGPSSAQGLDGWSRAFFGFFLGIALFRVRAHPRLAALHIHPMTAALVLSVILGWQTPARHRIIPDLLAALVLFPTIVAAGANTLLSGRCAKTCLWLGSMSYPIYILQSGPTALLHVTRIGYSLNAAQGITASIVAGSFVIMIAYAALKLVDEPAQRWFKGRRATSRTAPSSPPAIGPILVDR